MAVCAKAAFKVVQNMLFARAYELPQTYVCGFTVFPLPFFSSIPLSDLLM